MSRISIPPGTSIQLNGTVQTRSSNGKMEVYSENTEWPTVKVYLKDIRERLSEEEKIAFDADTLRSYESAFPVALDDEGFHTRNLWNILGDLNTHINSLTVVRHDYNAINEIYKQHNIHKRHPEIVTTPGCSALKTHHTWIGMMARLHGSHHIEEAGGEYKHTWGELVDTVSDPLSFRDNGLTLLDLAMRYQHWSDADTLWEKGVRWGENSELKNHPLLSLLKGSRRIFDGSMYKNRFLEALTPKAKSNDDPAECALTWLDTWLDRWMRMDGVLSDDEAKELIVKWAELTVKRSGPQAYAWNKLNEPHKALTKRWIFFWHDCKQDPMNGALKTSDAWGKDSGMTFREIWAESAGMNEAMTAFNLEYQLNSSTAKKDMNPKKVRL